MGLFDFFSKESKTTNERDISFGQRDFDLPQSNNADEKKAPLSVFVPTSFDDIEKIIDLLKTGKSAIVHLTNLKTETQIRVLDMLSGAVYALNGGVYEMQQNVFVFAPSGVEVL